MLSCVVAVGEQVPETMLFTCDELLHLRLDGLPDCPGSGDSDATFLDSDDVSDDVNVLWVDGESSDLFRGSNEFWDQYSTVN